MDYTHCFSSTSEIQVRIPSRSEMDLINDWRKQFYESVQDSSEFRFQPKQLSEYTELCSGTPLELFLIALVDDVPVGYLAFVSPKAKNIEEIFVEPRYRRQGVAKCLLHKAQSTLRSQGAKSTFATISADNEVAMRLFLTDDYHISISYYFTNTEYIEHTDCEYVATEITRDAAGEFCKEHKIFLEPAIWYLGAENKALLQIGVTMGALRCALNGDKDYYPALINALANIHFPENITGIYLTEPGTPTVLQGFMPYRYLVSKRLSDA